MIQKTAKATGDLIGKKIANKITRDSETSSKDDSERNEKEIVREKYLSPELRQKLLMI